MILLTGATGQVGTALAPLLAGHVELATTTRRLLDLDRPDSVTSVLDDLRPDVVVNCAAWTAVDAAEDHEAAATRANGHAVAAMAAWAEANDAWLVTFSTDYVFDGTDPGTLTEAHPTAPANAYGRSKLVGERAALASGAALVVRTSWVVSATHANFVATMLSLLGRGVDPRVVDDQVGCPTIAADLAAAVAGLLSTRPTGLLHLTNRGATTWCGLARRAAELAGHDPSRVQPCTTAEYPTPARRPARAVLASTRLAELGVTPLPRWEESLPRVVAGQLARLGAS